MMLCAGEGKYKCTAPNVTHPDDHTMSVIFTIVDELQSVQIHNIFSTDDFYIYDSFLNRTIFNGKGKKLCYVKIVYSDDLTYKIKIKILKKG